ncbi:hypothetical protein IF1G_04245 [Cordyceps javanica]|uniref:Uncharacterized protein n=1 Tax=Cordyceps javanica TaxID=43265 RepID=A0A545V5L0_9HYPO|nr:hypothetical protein IF1G_04245 [Cordyceps javanica]TQW08259.1 hypothetical protein IF2G_04135 [Cordyceps javanica]
MPSADAYHVSLQEIEQYLGSTAGATLIGYMLDQVLSAAQQPQETYSIIMATATTLSAATSSTENEPDGHVDYTALTLLTACHLRLSRYSWQWHKARKIVANAVLPAERQHFLLPHLQMGTFAVPQDRMASMVIMMLIDQQQGLVTEVTRLEEDVQQRARDSNDSLKRIFGVQNTVLLERAVVLLDDFKQMGEILARVDLFGSRHRT